MARIGKGVLLLGLCSVLLTSCANRGSDGSTVDFASSPSQAPSGDSVAGSILDFTAPRLGGGEVRGEEFAGKQLAIWFWAPW